MRQLSKKIESQKSYQFDVILTKFSYKIVFIQHVIFIKLNMYKYKYRFLLLVKY